MDWLREIFTTHSIAHTIVVYGLLIAAGIYLGRIKIFGTSLGVTWILFAGLIAAYLGISTDEASTHFLRDFGLILFVYTIGLQVGPGFFSSLKKNALINNLLAAAVVVLGVLITVIFFLSTKYGIHIMTGVMSGAVTNTPGLGAAQSVILSLKTPGTNASIITLAYAVAYPFGVFGIILSLIILKKLMRVNVDKERELHRRLAIFKSNKVISFHLNLENRQLVGKSLKNLFSFLKEPIVVSRMVNNGQIITPTPDTILHRDDVLLIVASRSQKEMLQTLIGSPSETNLKTNPKSHLTDRTVTVTRPEVTHRRLGDIPELHQQNFTFARVSRAGVEIMPEGDLFLQLGDTIKIVGTKEGVDRVTAVLGNSFKKLDVPDLAPIFLGIVLGILLGSIPLRFPGIPVAVKIGLAGGPLIVALLLSRFGGMLYLNNYTTVSANLMMRELGISLFLASVGLGSGHHLADAFGGGAAYAWMAMGLTITMLPLLIVGFIAHKYFKKTYFETCGLLAGASTDPPALAFAIKTAGSDIPSTTYATVYPLTMILRIVAAQLLILLLG